MSIDDRAIKEPPPKVFPNYQNPNRVPGGTDEIRPIGGIDLRDYFAPQFLSTVYAQMTEGYATRQDRIADYELAAERAYMMADAFLKARTA